jgi:hypothetical protein
MAINLEKSHSDKSEAEVQRYIQLIKQHYATSNADGPTLESLNSQLAAEQKNHQTHLANLKSLLLQQAKEQLEWAQKASDLSVKVASLIPDVVLAIRTELELPIDAQEYRNLYAAELQWSAQTTKEILSRLRLVIPALESA